MCWLKTKFYIKELQKIGYKNGWKTAVDRQGDGLSNEYIYENISGVGEKIGEFEASMAWQGH